MTLRIGSKAPDFTAMTTQGPMSFHEWIGDGWCVLFSHPKNFTPVCTTELGYMAGLLPEFQKRNVKIVGLSVDPVEDHERWAVDIKDVMGHAVTYPMIGDSELKVAKLYASLSADERRKFRTLLEMVSAPPALMVPQTPALPRADMAPNVMPMGPPRPQSGMGDRRRRAQFVLGSEPEAVARRKKHNTK